MLPIVIIFSFMVLFGGISIEVRDFDRYNAVRIFNKLATASSYSSYTNQLRNYPGSNSTHIGKYNTYFRFAC